MSRHKGVDVRILNPASGRGYTSRKCAERYVRRGVARWVEDSNGRNCIEFLADGAMPAVVAASVQRTVDATRYWYERAANTGMAQLSELAHLPMIRPALALGFGRRKGASKHTFLATEGF